MIFTYLLFRYKLVEPICFESFEMTFPDTKLIPKPTDDNDDGEKKSVVVKVRRRKEIVVDIDDLIVLLTVCI
jgi:hypothetical protein